MYRIYNKNTGKFYAGHGGWSNRGKVWMRRNDLLCSFNYYKHDELFMENLSVYEYADDGTRTIHEDLKTFIETKAKKISKRTPFKVGFINDKMSSWISIHDAKVSKVEYVDGLTTFTDLLELEKMDYCRSGTGAWFRGAETGKKYYALPSAFMKMIPLMVAGTIMGTFGYVNRGRYSKGIELREHRNGLVNTSGYFDLTTING